MDVDYGGIKINISSVIKEFCLKKIEDFKVGDKAEFSHVITMTEIQKFAEITGDDNPLHVNRKYADQTSFKGIVAHGMLSASFFSTMVGKHLPGDGALWIKQSLNFLLPVRPGDELKIQAEVRQISLSQRTMTIYASIHNQFGQKVLDGEGVVTVLNIEKPEQVLKSEKPIPTVLITGASRGIGSAAAMLLGQSKSRIVLNYNSDKESAEELCQSLIDIGADAIAVQADVSDSVQVQKMVKKAISHYGTLTGLVNNACPKIIPVKFLDSNWDDYQKHIDVQLKGMFNCTKEVLPFFLQNKNGSIVSVASIAADNPPIYWSSYVASKSSMIGLNRSLAHEFGPSGIRFNVVSPGTTDTKMISEIPEKARLLIKMQTPLRQIATPEDVAGTIEFLLSDRSKHITGEIIRVCGGQVML